MKISEVKVKLLGSDVLSIVNEFVKVDGLNLKNIIINDGIEIEGTFKKGFSVDFSVKAEILGCENNKIKARLSKVKLFNFGIFRLIRSFVLKKLSKEFEEFGIASNKDIAIIDIKKILNDIPYVDLNINEIYTKSSEVWVEADNIEVSIAGSLIKEKISETINENKQEEEIYELENINKIKDNYSAGRNILAQKLPDNIKEYKDYLFILPDLVSLIYRLLKDKRVPIKTKLVMSAAVAYVMFPSDLIPNNIPFIGVIDDIGVIFFALNRVVSDVPLSLIVENWEGSNDIIIVIKNGLEYLTNFTAATNVEKLYEFVEELSTL
ncbi:YkvA family protein [Clostridium butyricum]|uniref:YkvA family protein n=1 Tax=Clostridium butyricum TaxID=1492 RepID=UPI0032BF3DA7